MNIRNKNGKERVIGDLHFFDPNIIEISGRPFKSVDEMNEHMINEWNSVTEEHDTVIVNGDFIDFRYCTQEQGYSIINRLNGDIVLIVGTHDKPFLPILKTISSGIEVIEYPILKDEFWIISHEPQFVSMASPYANVFSHVHTNPMYNDVSPRSFCTSAERLGYKPIEWEAVKRAVLNYKGKGCV